MIKFNQPIGQKRSIISNRPIDKIKDNCYFELEMTDVDQNIDVALGMCIKDRYNSGSDPGLTDNGVSLHSLNGEVYYDKNMKVCYEFNAQYGETIGNFFKYYLLFNII